MGDKSTKTIATNRKAFFDYFVTESLEAGIELCGTEVKSLRKGNLSFKDSWCEIASGEIFVHSMHISPYEQGNIFNRDPVRKRRLLLHKREILRLFGVVKQGGFTLVPLSVYFKGSLVKVQLGVCKGKRNFDKRQAIAQRSAKREIEQRMKTRE